MGLFQDNVVLINRAPIDLTGRFDGQEITLKPGENIVPRITVSYIKNQNPIMGTHDADNPNITGGQYLVGQKGTKDPVAPLTKEEWESHCSRPCRIDEEAFFEDRLGKGERVMLKGKGRQTQARSAFDAGVRVHSPELATDNE